MTHQDELIGEQLGSEGVLTGIRVIDLAHPCGQYCGKLLADLGADVIKVEQSGGDLARRLGPFKDDRPDLETSLFFAYYNTNKRSLALDLGFPAGQDVFRRLVRKVDAVVQTPDPANAPGFDFDYEALQGLNSSLVLASIVGFGGGGPYSAYRSTSQVAFALSGLMKGAGPPAGPPQGPPGQMVFDLTAVDAASGIVSALIAREVSGRGQHIIVAAHEVLAGQVNPRPSEQFDDTRRDPRASTPTLAPSGTYQCRDGAVVLAVYQPGHWLGLKQLLGNPTEVQGPEWNERAYRQTNAKFLIDRITKSLADRWQAEVVAEAQDLHIPCGPVNTTATLARDPQVTARGFFVEAASPSLGTYRMPGAPYQLSDAGWAIHRPAPRLGQHSREILVAELGYSSLEVEALAAAGVVALDQQQAAISTGIRD